MRMLDISPEHHLETASHGLDVVITRHPQLILQPGQIVLEVGPGHHLPGQHHPAGHLGHDPSRHVLDEAVRSVEEIEEICPDGFSSFLSKVPENVDSVLVFLQEVVHQGEEILDGLVLADVPQQVVERLGDLHGVLGDDPLPLLVVGAVKPGDEGEVVLGDHLRPEEQISWILMAD